MKEMMLMMMVVVFEGWKVVGLFWILMMIIAYAGLPPVGRVFWILKLFLKPDLPYSRMPKSTIDRILIDNMRDLTMTSW